MRGFGASSLDFELLGWIRLPEQRGLARHQMLMEIDERFAAEGIKIPFPQLDLHLQDAKSNDPGKKPEDS
jgi:small-conductance mechanosensitive channel